MGNKNAVRFSLHLALLQEREGLTLSKARLQAWLEGPHGLEKRLGELPLTAPIQEKTK